MTRDEILARFPRASEAFIRANLQAVPRPPAPSPSPRAPRPAKAKETTSNERLNELTATFNRAESDYLASLAILECNLRAGPLATSQTENSHPRKFLVRVTSFRRRLLDEDNLCEKYHVDCCRYSGLLRADDPSEARIVTTQEKVQTKAEERTVIEINEID